MSSRPFLKPFSVVTDGDMSGNITSDITIIQQLSMVSYGYTWTGTSPVGTIKVQASNDYSVDAGGNVKNAGNWATLTLDNGGTPAAAIDLTGNSGTGLIDIVQTAGYALRTVYTRTSGVGTLNVVINAKVM
jgi:hypothetical protein